MSQKSTIVAMLGDYMMSQKSMIVAMLGNYVSDVNDYFYDDETDEVWYWNGDCKVCTSFDEFVFLAYDKWSGSKHSDD